MRLKHIKLAGFKSFVDPTTVTFPGSRCAVVGPNGCGKSNIIDAVRWVMGESSARQLRGESITDVIFNGSVARQPTAMASIELVFDNSDGRIGGEYASYAEIAIRRQVTRDAQSTYFLNGNKCRRRDIMDIFLGTGFGPRSYSIIEQGMISQLVEAKPEDLRVYLEEAAGISKYKERRRETENRIRHTQENLDRLNDIRDELERQLQHLNRQAKAAERYRELKEEERRVTAELFTLRLISLDSELGARDGQIRELEVELEKVRAAQRALDTQIEHARDEHVQHNDAFNQVQGRYYQVGAEIARIEESVQFSQQRVRQLETDVATIGERQAETARQLAMDHAQIESLETSLAAIEPEVDAARMRDAAASEQLADVEARARDWQMRWDAFNDRAAANQRQGDVQASRVEHVEQLLERLQARRGQLDGEYQIALGVQVGDEVDELANEIARVEAELRTAETAITVCLDELGHARELAIGYERDLDAARTRFQSSRHDLASLDAVQQAALGRASGGAADAWLASSGLAEHARVGERLSVANGWEHAAEVVLGDRLQAIEVDDVGTHAQALAALEQGLVTLYEGAVTPTSANASVGLPALASVVSSPLALGSMLDGVFIAETLDEALAARPTLAPRESIITRTGLWIGPDWMRYDQGQQPESGIIERGHALEQLRRHVAEAETELAALLHRHDAARQQVEALTERREALNASINATSHRLGRLRADHGVHRVRQEEADARRARVARERAELEQQVAHEQTRLAEAQAALAQASEARIALDDERALLVEQRDANDAELDAARQRARAERDQFHRLNGERQAFDSKLSATRTARERLLQQQRELEHRERELRDSVAGVREPLPALQAELEAKLDERLRVEQQLNDARQRLERVDATIRELDATRGAHEAAVNDVRSALETARVDRQGLAVKHTTLLEQLAATGYEHEAVKQALPPDADDAVWAERLDKVLARIQRLGPINLAAIDEFRSQSERKQYLDAQHADLEEALETLRNAIRRIDRDTRARFKDTFQEVNQRLGVLFPKVFGGGHASLELTGEDLLDTGVALMAQPPGKRNSSVQLLSGGEKALTAIALIFAIFQLNPSPVCLLDEVDAPLDDANVGRFADLIRTMSEDVQFVIITHNKLTMEMADHLLGVTMNEPGVSRLVSVDVEEAAAMAAV
jgi:chromosome segregation protein